MIGDIDNPTSPFQKIHVKAGDEICEISFKKGKPLTEFLIDSTDNFVGYDPVRREVYKDFKLAEKPILMYGLGSHYFYKDKKGGILRICKSREFFL